MTYNYYMVVYFNTLQKLEMSRKSTTLQHSKAWNSDFYNNLKGLQSASTPNSQVYAFVNQGWKVEEVWFKQISVYFLPRRILFCLISFTDVNFEENMV